MSLSSVRTYYKARALELGWKEWTDAFNVNNIPSSIFDGAFHTELGRVAGIQQNQYDLVTEVPITVRYFRKGYRDPQAVLDLSVAAAESYIRKALLATNRLVGEGIKNVRLTAVEWVKQADSNDNLIMTQMDFTTLVILAVD